MLQKCNITDGGGEGGTLEMIRKMVLTLAGVAAMTVAVPAAAAKYLFQLSGPVSGEFTLDSDTIPFADDAQSLAYIQVATTIAGVDGDGVDVDLFSGSTGGGLRLTANSSGDILLTASGAQLYSRSSTGALSFSTGTFSLTDAGGGSAMLAVAAVPEPATWALMIAGFGLAGGALRSQRRRALAAA